MKFENKEIRCPYCLQQVKVTPLPHEGLLHSLFYHHEKLPESRGECMPIHRNYVEDLVSKKLAIAVVGATGHGKSCFSEQLTNTIVKLEATGAYYIQTLDAETAEKKVNWGRTSTQWSAIGTSEQYPSPILYQATIPFPKVGNQYIFSYYDAAGKSYTEATRLTQEGRFVFFCDAIFYVLSVKEMSEESNNLNPRRFLDTYLRLRPAGSKKAQLVFVLTKADCIDDPDLRQFILERSINKYAEEQMKSDLILDLENRSEQIKTWLCEKNSGFKGIIEIVQREFRDVKFTLVSSLGADFTEKTWPLFNEEQDPRGVLDPLLLVLNANLSSSDSKPNTKKDETMDQDRPRKGLMSWLRGNK